MYTFNHLDHFNIVDMDSVIKLLVPHGCHTALIKKLPQNANDKNQIYIHSDASMLNSLFEMKFRERGQSNSVTKRSSKPGKVIPEAIFNSFHWLGIDGKLEKAISCKAIVYSQYPETRISGLMTIDGNIPRSMSVDYTKRTDQLSRYMIIGANKNGDAIALIAINPETSFVNTFSSLQNYHGSRVCKAIPLPNNDSYASHKLLEILMENVANKTLIGCRLDKFGNTIPFNGTQVHGYTLEHACGIKPNADKNGDIFGIELKCFTRKKLTLFTPEPDGGIYHDDFKLFMTTYGYLKDDNYRFTGLHRAYVKNNSTNLTLRIVYLKAIKVKDSDGNNDTIYERSNYDRNKNISSQMNQLEVVLEDSYGNIAASWSVERLMNCWGAKHNEVVYVPAEKLKNTNSKTLQEGFEWNINYGNTVLWCKNTNIDRLFQAIDDGTIYLDPAPKYNPYDATKTKRRSQWRINDIYTASQKLYDTVEEKTLSPSEEQVNSVAI